MKKVVIYIHGQGGSPTEAKHYESLFKDADIIGFDYQADNPWDARIEFSKWFDQISQQYQSVIVIANSLGAYYTMNALYDRNIEKAYFISPIVNMQKLIEDMMQWSNITEDELKQKGIIETKYQTLSWKYLNYVKSNPIQWNIPTYILYGDKDYLTSLETIQTFTKKTHAKLTIMQNSEHWFHTPEQMDFIDQWIMNNKD